MRSPHGARAGAVEGVPRANLTWSIAYRAGPAHRPRASDFDLAQVSEVMSADMEPESEWLWNPARQHEDKARTSASFMPARLALCSVTAGRFAIERLASALDAPLGAVKQMVHKRKAVLSLTPDDVNTRVDTLADVCDVSDLPHKPHKAKSQRPRLAQQDLMVRQSPLCTQ